MTRLLITLIAACSLQGQILLPIIAGKVTSAPATPTLVSHIVMQSTDTNGFTTGTFDTTGADFIVCAAGNYFDPKTVTVSDNKGNGNYTALTTQGLSGTLQLTLYYITNPTVGTGHTITIADSPTSSFYPSIACAAFSGIATASPFDVENGNKSASASSLQPGSITPSANGYLLIVGTEEASAPGNGLMSINSGFTTIDEAHTGTSGVAVSLNYFVQTTAAAINPTATFVGTNILGVVIASFKHQ